MDTQSPVPYVRQANRANELCLAAQTVPALLERRAAENASQFALSAPSYRGYRIRETFAELNAHTERIARWLDASVPTGGRVATVLPARALREAVHFGIACLKAGLVWVPLDSELTDDELSWALDTAGPLAVVCLDEDRERVSLLAPNAKLLFVDNEEVGHARLVSSHLPSRLAPADIACVTFTSGTTGPAKMVMHSHVAALSAAMSAGVALKIFETDVFQCSPERRAGLNILVACLIPWIRGAGAVLQSDSDDECSLLDLADEEGTTILQGAPSAVSQLAADYLLRGNTSLRLKKVVCAGSKMSTALGEQIRKLFAPVEIIRIWGTTETGWVGASSSSEGQPSVSSSGGIPMLGCQVSILDRAGEPVAAGIVGEIAVRGPTVSCGYACGSPNTAFLHGWFRTSDLGYFDAAGRLHFIDRVADAVQIDTLISSQSVEEVIRRFPGVEDVAVVQVRQSVADMPSEIAACVVRKRSATTNGHQLAAFCATRLPAGERPRYWYFMDALPRGAYGNVLKRKLRESVAHLSPVSRPNRLSA